MDYDDDDPWAKQSPENEKNNALDSPAEVLEAAVKTALPASTSTGSIVRKDSDEEAWNDADSDGENNQESFVEATSRMSLSASFVAQEDDDQGGFGDNSLHQSPPSMHAPLAGPSTFPSTFDETPSVSGPPLDDFDDADDDGFGDFGDPTQAGEDDDDFGAFDEAGIVEDGSFGFEGETAGEETAAAIPHVIPSQRGTLNSEEDSMPAPNIDWQNIWQDKDALTKAIIGYFEQVYPNIYEGVDNSVERNEAWDRIDMTLNPQEILLQGNTGAKRLLEELHDPTKFPIPIKPWDWKRSNIRLEALREKGIPVNLDDVCLHSRVRAVRQLDLTPSSPIQFAPPTKMDPLVLPSIRTTAASPAKDKRSLGSPINGRGSRPGSRTASPTRLSGRNSSPASPSTPSRSPARQNSQVAIPALDQEKAQTLANMPEEELNIKSLDELKKLRNELQSSAIEASQHLTALLEQKEILAGQNETYNAMIQVCFIKL